MTAIKRGHTVTEQDLPILFDKQGCSSDPYSIVFDYLDCTTGTPVLIGNANRVPVKFGVGKYYPPITIADDELLGTHIIRWKYKESVADTEKEIDREFDVLPLQAATGPQYPQRIQELIYELRKKLRDINPDRDYSIAGEEKLIVIINNEDIELTIEELYNITYEEKALTESDEKIKKAFENKKLKVKSVNINGNVEVKIITDVLKHFVPFKDIHSIELDNEKHIIVTEDHSIYTFDENNQIKKVKPSDYPEEIIFVNDDNTELRQIIENKIIEFRQYMYDLSVEDNQNFVLESGILASNSFAPPSSEATIAGFNKCRGYRWPDEQLANHIAQAANYINLFAPISCFDICEWPCLLENLLLKQAMVYALYDMVSLWISEEFSYSLNGVSLEIERSSKYQSFAGQVQEQVDKQLERSKLPLMRSTKGLKQSPYTFSRGSMLGPYTSGINVRRYVR